jgi:hypothetical protein
MLASKQLILRQVSTTREITRTGQHGTPEGRPPARRNLIFAIVSIGLFMASIDQTNVMVSQHVAAGQRSAT